MPTLLNPQGIIKNEWLLSEGPATDQQNARLVPESRWQGAPQGLILAADAELAARYCDAPIIAIEFPMFNDGRGLSLAVLLRTQLNYQGEIRAIGAVHPDLLHYMIRCGFDSFELADNYDQETALRVLQPHKAYYQGSVINADPVYRRLNRSS